MPPSESDWISNGTATDYLAASSELDRATTLRGYD